VPARQWTRAIQSAGRDPVGGRPGGGSHPRATTHRPQREQRNLTAPPTPSDGKLAAKKENQESAKKRIECKEQVEKLLSDADRRAYMKECMSKER
jgi:hypothetical protein